MSRIRPNGWRAAAAVLLIASTVLVSKLGAAEVGIAKEQTGPTPPTEAQRAQIEKQLKELRAMQEQMSRDMTQFEARIKALESQLQGTLPQGTPPAAVAGSPAQAPAAIPAETQAAPADKAVGLMAATPEKWENYQALKGITVTKGDWGDLSFNMTSYMRYLNQEATSNNYTDAFGRTYYVDRRQDFQLAKVQLTFKGWLYDPKFNWNFYVWTSNAAQGQGAQVVVAGNLHYDFNSHFQLYAGVHSLPSTRSTNRTFPYWLRNDNRPIADEFFRASYTTGIWAQGVIVPGLEYRAMIANNLSTLGVSAAQLDAHPNTLSGAIWWMPTTKEYGPLAGFGDYEYHRKVATLFGLNFTSSIEDRQSQPGTNSIENTQLRLSDGTLLFANNAFNTGGSISKARYQMADFNAGAKYHGLALEAEYYWRRLDDFQYTGLIPVSSVWNTGYQLQASAMLVPREWQVYLSGSQIYGRYGNPYDIGLGVNWFPFKRKEVRLDTMALYVQRAPVGYTAYPTLVGSDGWILVADWAINF